MVSQSQSCLFSGIPSASDRILSFVATEMIDSEARFEDIISAATIDLQDGTLEFRPRSPICYH
jgi:hypothetical protein